MNKMQDLIHILVSIETRVYREGITQLLEKYNDIHVIATTSSLQDTFELCSTASPDILLLDATLPEQLSTIRKVRADFPAIKIILMSMQACRNQMSKFAGEGVEAFVTREDSIDDLYQAICAAMKNGFWCSSRVAKVLLDQHTAQPEPVTPLTDSPLTRQQENVLQLLESGISNKEIARRLHIEAATVKNHVHHILQRLQVNSRGEAAAIYRKFYHDYNAV
jgi:two-component system, NarL family, nitrate/nitrite response regulator NarL